MSADVYSVSSRRASGVPNRRSTLAVSVSRADRRASMIKHDQAHIYEGNLWKPRTKNISARTEEMLAELPKFCVGKIVRSWILFIAKPFWRASLSPSHFGGCRAKGRGAFADASQLNCRVWQLWKEFSSYSCYIYSFHRNMQELSIFCRVQMFPTILTGFFIGFSMRPWILVAPSAGPMLDMPLIQAQR